MANAPKFEIELAGYGAGWTDITTDVMANQDVSCKYGIFGTGPMDRVASTGTLDFALDNSATNSGGVRGYYSLEHASKRTGFNLGCRIRFSYLVSATRYYKFIGRLSKAVPVAGKQNQITKCTAVDWFDQAAKTQVTSLPLQTNKRADELITSLIAAMQVSDRPVSTTLGTGTETYVLALDESLALIAELQKICMSEFGFCYLRGNTTAGGEVVFETRYSRLVSGAAAATITDAEIWDLSNEPNGSAIVNVVRAKTHPRTSDAAATTILYQIPSASSTAPPVSAGQTIFISGQYSDPTLRAVKVSGKDMVAPVATTHYTANTLANGTGTDLTASFTVTAVYAGDHVFYTITNTSATDGFLTLLKAVGRGVYDYQPVTAQASDTAVNIAQYGQQDLEVDLPYQSDSVIGAAVASFIMARWSTPIGAGKLSVTLKGEPSNLDNVIGREPGDRVSLTETTTGLNITAYISGVELLLPAWGLPRVKWTLYRGEPIAYWNLEVPGHSELDQTTRLGPL